MSLKTILQITLALTLAVGFMSCDEDAPQSSTGGSMGSGGAPSKLAQYVDDPCALLTEEMVRAVVPKMAAEVEHQTGAGSMKFCSFAWDGSRKAATEVGGQTIESPVADTVSLKWLRKARGDDPLAYFQNAYRTPTPEELAKLQEQMRKALEKKVAEGTISESAARTGEGVGKSMFSGARFEAVEGVGTAAAWGGAAGTPGLKVLSGDMEFEISVNAYEDEAKNRDASIRLAKAILEKAR
jgi:hypothetical protein